MCVYEQQETSEHPINHILSSAFVNFKLYLSRNLASALIS